jgi:CubicO group peptidase (beta-lactamase class C family)
VDGLEGLESWPGEQRAAGWLAADGRTASAGQLDHQYRLASVTKVLTTCAVLVAVEEQTIALDDPVADLPGATVRHLLAHASGLGPAGQVLSAPGARRIYSNAGFDRLGEMVTTASGLAFATYLDEALVAPLAMRATRLVGSPAADGTSTVGDLSALAGELLAPRLLDPATVTAATSVAFPGIDGVLPGYGRQRPNDWGLGLELRGHKSPHWTGTTNSQATYGHFGQSGTFLWVDPIAGIALVCLTDRPFGDWALPRWPALADTVLAALT